MYHYLHVYNQTCQLYDTAVFVDTLTAILPAPLRFHYINEKVHNHAPVTALLDANEVESCNIK